MANKPRVRNLYYLKLVEPQDKQVNALAYKQHAIREWLDDLPTVNTGMVTRQFHEKLIKINNSTIAFQDQFNTLEAFQSVYLGVEEFLHFKICGESLPLSEKTQKIVSLQVDIIREYANAYWYLLKTGQEQLGNRAFSKYCPILIQRILTLLGNILKTHYIAHVAEPTWIWMDIHSLFNILPQKASESTRIKFFSSSADATTTIADTYKKIIALSMADPYGMYDREIMRLDHFLNDWATKIKLEKIAPGQIPLGYFICMDTDKAPSWAKIDADIDEDSDTFQLFMDDAIKVLLQKAEPMESNLGRYFAATAFPVTENSFDPEVIKHIHRQWEGEPARQPVIFDSSLHREIAIGLNAIAEAILHQDDEQSSSLFQAEVTARKCLKCTLDSGNQIAIGSLVGYRKADGETNEYGIGLISRMLVPGTDGATLFELKNVTNSVQAVTIELVEKEKPSINNNQTTESKPEITKNVALAFHKRINDSVRLYLLVESRGFKMSDMIVVHEEERSSGAVVTKMNNLGLGYVVLEYLYITEVKRVEPIPTSGYDFL
ncbi:MAG: hypothetical protein K0U68_05560 [Gammaproteobacteria bacterium]|nr:hypothetical protein [Gammaproteobacteria bacterium]